MKKCLTLLGLVLLANVSAQFNCVTDKKMKQFYGKNPQAFLHQKDLYNYLSSKNTNTGKNTQTVITIPIVVHILYKNAVQNISDVQITSQIAVLNQDFRKLNADSNNAPDVFKPVRSDMEVMFCLATKNPSGNITNGIVRKSVSNNFNFEEDYFKSVGSVAWDPTKYLNIWVGNPNDPNLGGWSSVLADVGNSDDGIGMNYTTFGTIGTAIFPYNKGRSMTHEVGHYLGLLHPFGEDTDVPPNSANCGTPSFDDFCADTPATYYPYSGSPTFPNNTYTCTPTSSGAMFMNFMDYTRDEVKVMFTNDQKTIVTNTLAGPRASLLNSNGCSSVLGVHEVEKVNSITIFPNPSSQYISIASPLMKINTAEIFNSEGRLVKKAEIKNETYKIDVRDLASGVYFVRTYNNYDFVKSMKFIKK